MPLARLRSRTTESAEPGAQRAVGAPRVALLLVALALLPLSGAGWFAARELTSVQSTREQAAAVDHDTRELVRLTELRASLIDERNWRAAVMGLTDIGLSASFVTALIGIDLEAEWIEAAARVDALAVAIDDPEIDAALAEIRREDRTDLTEMARSYEALGLWLDSWSQLVFDDLLAVAGDLPDGAELITTARVLESAAETRESVAQQLSSFFSARFSGTETARTEMEVLLQQQAIYTNAAAQIERSAAPDSLAADRFAAVAASPEVAEFDRSVKELIESVKDVIAEGRVSGLAFIGDDIAGVASQFEGGTASSDLHLELVTAAGNDVIISSQLLTERADAQTRQAIATIAALAILSIAFAIALTRFIGRPLKLLAETATKLRDGESDEDFRPRGPSEIRQAAYALNDAGANIRLVERQAKALARGDLTSPVLLENAPGGLGASLQEAVQTLAASLSEREEFRRRLAHEASHDGLTQLPNRKACLEQLSAGLARSERTNSTLAVIFIDLDGFKTVNDQFGHPAGDFVLETTSARLLGGVREGDHVGRLGGDEFVVIAEPVASVEEAELLAERLLASISAPIALGKATVRVGGSIGISLFEQDGATADEMLRDADLAVYKAKDNGRNQVVVCDDELRATVVEQGELEHALRDAIENDELSVYYQPIVDPLTDKHVGLEALIRWIRPGVGLVPPDSFIPFAERSDLIIDVDCWVMQRVARQLDDWRRVSGSDALLPVSINISGRHLSVDEFVEDIMGPLDSHAIDSSLIVIEVTESALLDDLGGAAAKLQSLRDRGVKVAIDDFGTGYTSLAHLKTLPIDILKIDQSFTRDDSAASLVKLIIDTGHLLGVSITSEGIETSEQAQALSDMGSDDLQGYFYGRPCPPEELEFHRSAISPPTV